MSISFVLPNGIRVIHKQTRSPVIFCGLTVEAGTRDELVDEHGMAHFVEHALFKGTTKRSAYRVNNLLESAGGELNAFTSKEETVIHACVTSRDFAKAVELIADIVFNSVFPEHEIDLERQVIGEEIDSCNDYPSELIFDDFEDLLFRGSPLGRNILGTKKSIGTFSRKDLLKFTSRTYCTDRMVFASTGKISAQRLKYLCEKYLGVAPPNHAVSRRTPPDRYIVFDRTERKKTHQSHVLVGNRGYDRYDNRRTAMLLLLNHLGGPSSNSVLNVLLREKHGLVYNVEANCSMYDDSGSVTIYYASASAGIAQTDELIRSELTKTKTELMTEYRLRKAKKQFIGQYVIAQENGENLIQTMAKSLLNHNRYEDCETVAKQIEAVTAEQIRDAANEIFAFDEMSKLIYGNM